MDDLERTKDEFEELLRATKAYRQALTNLADAQAKFGKALEAVSRLKVSREVVGGGGVVVGRGPSGGLTSMSASVTFGPDMDRRLCSGETLLLVSGVQHMLANYDNILADALYRGFEIPVVEERDNWQHAMDAEAASYKRSLDEKVAAIKVARRRVARQTGGVQDLDLVRGQYGDLVGRLDEIAALRDGHRREVRRACGDLCGALAERSCSLLRTQLDIADALARKGGTGGGLEDLMQRGEDLLEVPATDAAASHVVALGLRQYFQPMSGIGGIGGSGIGSGSGGGGSGGGGGGDASTLIHATASGNDTPLFSILPRLGVAPYHPPSSPEPQATTEDPLSPTIHPFDRNHAEGDGDDERIVEEPATQVLDNDLAKVTTSHWDDNLRSEQFQTPVLVD